MVWTLCAATGTITKLAGPRGSIALMDGEPWLSARLPPKLKNFESVKVKSFLVKGFWL